MSSKVDILSDVMRRTRTTQVELARLSGVEQPSISQYLSGKTGFSDEQLGRLLGCMGYELQVVRTSTSPDLTRAERRSWLLHREVSKRLTEQGLREWMPTLSRNLDRLATGVRGEPHTRNLDTWRRSIRRGDLTQIRGFLTGLDRESIEMREVSPFSGILTDEDRVQVLERARG